MNELTASEAYPPYGMTVARTPEIGERRVILHGVKWATYKALLNDIGDSRTCRFAFDSGDLEIMSPLIPHENSQFSIGQLVLIMAEELGLPCSPLGSLTCEREDLGKAIEPDGCFYIQHLKQVRGLKKLDFTIHPPPDLMVEVDISTDSMSKLTICAALGVPEHWRFDGTNLEIRILKSGRYFEATESLAFPGLPLTEKVAEFIPMGIDDATSTNRRIRTWIRDELRKQKSPRHPRGKKIAN